MVVTILVVGAGNPIVVVVVVVVADDGIEIVGALVAIENGVVVIGWERRFESALFPDEVIVDVAGRKLVEDGNADVVVVVVPAGAGNEKGALVVVVGIIVDVDDGVENEKADVVAVEKPGAAVVVAGVDKEKDGAA